MASRAFQKISLPMKRFICVAAALAILSQACAKEQAVHIRCELSVAKALPSAGPADLVFALTNSGENVVQVLNWQTPFEGVKAPMFTITHDGAEVEYRGLMLKRGAPHKEDYLVLKPGERREARINLADAWDVGAPGNYTVEYVAELFDVIEGTGPAPRALDQLSAVPLTCNSITFTRLR